MGRLQKKDTYGVFAKPVDEEEVPGYFDIINSPMDFSTIRSTIAAGGYATWAAFAADVKLLTNNAMTFNPPDTIYHKQVFQKLLELFDIVRYFRTIQKLYGFLFRSLLKKMKRGNVRRF